MMDYNIKCFKSRRKTIAISIDKELNVIVKAPYYMSNREIEKFVYEKSDWIEKHLKIVKERNEQSANVRKITKEELDELYRKALAYIPARVCYFANILGIDFGRITIRCQKTRWGSCSSKGNLNFNCLLMMTPREVIDYVVIHELCHRIELNHSNRFWNLVEKACPDYKKHKKWLKDNGLAIMEAV